MERLGDLRFHEAEDRWEVSRVWKGCKDDDQSSVFVPVNVDLVPSLTRKLKPIALETRGRPSSVRAVRGVSRRSGW